MPVGTVGKGGLQACRQIVQRPEPIGRALGGCLISWCIISDCLLCQFATGATPSSQFRGPYGGHRIAMGTFIRSLTNAASIILTDPITTHSFCIHTMPLTHTDISSTAVTNVAHSKLFSISFCNICGLSSNLNSVHQYLQSSNPHALFLTETKIKPLDSNDNSILCPHLKCPQYELFSSFFSNGGVCAFVCSDVQSSRLPHNDIVNPGFQLIWMKISLPRTSKFICTLYRSPNSPNRELLFDHLSKTIDTITLPSPCSEITVLGDFDVYNPNWLTHSPYITSPAGHDAEAFAIVNNLSQLISEPTRIPDHSGGKANTLDLFPTSNPDIYSNPILDSSLGNSDHSLIMLQHNFVSHQDRSSSSQKVFHYSKSDWDSLRNWGSDNLVKFNEEKTKQVVISRKNHQDFPLFS